VIEIGTENQPKKLFLNHPKIKIINENMNLKFDYFITHSNKIHDGTDAEVDRNTMEMELSTRKRPKNNWRQAEIVIYGISLPHYIITYYMKGAFDTKSNVFSRTATVYFENLSQAHSCIVFGKIVINGIVFSQFKLVDLTNGRNGFVNVSPNGNGFVSNQNSFVNVTPNGNGYVSNQNGFDNFSTNGNGYVSNQNGFDNFSTNGNGFVSNPNGFVHITPNGNGYVSNQNGFVNVTPNGNGYVSKQSLSLNPSNVNKSNSLPNKQNAPSPSPQPSNVNNNSNCLPKQTGSSPNPPVAIPSNGNNPGNPSSNTNCMNILLNYKEMILNLIMKLKKRKIERMKKKTNELQEKLNILNAVNKQFQLDKDALEKELKEKIAKISQLTTDLNLAQSKPFRKKIEEKKQHQDNQ